MPKSKAKVPRATDRQLSLKERAFVDAIASPDSPTFGNGTRSALASHIGRTPNSAAVAASKLLRKSNLTSAIEDTFRKHQLSIEVRSGILKGILNKSTTDIEQLDADGTIRSVTRLSNDKIRLATIRELNRMDGTYARAEAVGHAQAKVLDPLIEEWTRRLRAELRDAPRSADALGMDHNPADAQPTAEDESTAEPEQGSQPQAASPDVMPPVAETALGGMGGDHAFQ